MRLVHIEKIIIHFVYHLTSLVELCEHDVVYTIIHIVTQ